MLLPFLRCSCVCEARRSYVDVFSLLSHQSFATEPVLIPTGFASLCEKLGLKDIVMMDALAEQVWTQCEQELQRHLPMIQSLGSQVFLHMEWRPARFIQLPHSFHSLCQVFCHGYVGMI